jgi:hypothetical protein
VDSKQAKLRYGYETSKVHKEQKKPRLLISHEPHRDRDRGKTSFSWLRVVRVEEVSSDLGLPNTFFNMMLMLLQLLQQGKGLNFEAPKYRLEQSNCSASIYKNHAHKTTKTRTRRRDEGWVGGQQ